MRTTGVQHPRVLQLNCWSFLRSSGVLPNSGRHGFCVVLKSRRSIAAPVAQAVVGGRHAEHGFAATAAFPCTECRHGGSARRSRRVPDVVPNGGVVSSLRNLISSGAFLPSFRRDGLTPGREPPPESMSCCD